MAKFNPHLSLLIVDDHFVFRAGIKAVLSLRRDFQVVAEAGDAATALSEFRSHEPGMTLMDLRLPDDTGIVFQVL